MAVRTMRQLQLLNWACTWWFPFLSYYSKAPYSQVMVSRPSACAVSSCSDPCKFEIFAWAKKISGVRGGTLEVFFSQFYFRSWLDLPSIAYCACVEYATPTVPPYSLHRLRFPHVFQRTHDTDTVPM